MTPRQSSRLVRTAIASGFAAAILLPGAAAWSQSSTKPAPDSSSPQMAVPAPHTGSQADTPGGSAKDGVIRPPSTGGVTPVIRPPANGTMPVIPPAGTPNNKSGVVPK